MGEVQKMIDDGGQPAEDKEACGSADGGGPPAAASAAKEALIQRLQQCKEDLLAHKAKDLDKNSAYLQALLQLPESENRTEAVRKVQCQRRDIINYCDAKLHEIEV